MIAESLSRPPTNHDGMILVSASIAVHVHTSPAFCRGGLCGRHVLLLRVDEIPDFIDLKALAGQIAKHTVLIPRSGLSGINHKLDHGVLACASHSRDGPNRRPLAE